MSLSDKIQAYLDQNNIQNIGGDFITGIPDNQIEQILHWDVKLGAQPTQEQLDFAWSVKVAADNAVEYKAKRKAEYPSAADYLDGIVKGDQAQIQAYIDACLAVKAKYPKE